MSLGDAGQDRGGNLDASTINHYLKGLEFPAKKEDVAANAEGHGAPQDMVRQIRNANTDSFDSPEEVMQALQSGLDLG